MKNQDDTNKEMEANDVNTLISSIIFFLGGLFGFLCLQRFNQKEYSKDFGELSDSLRNVSDDSTLVLLISADRANLIGELKIKEQVTKYNWEELYSATQFLWKGTELEFIRSNFSNYFSNKYEIEIPEFSECDVCFVCIHLIEMDAGFSPNAPQIDRRDAFERLPEISRKVIVSSRLSSDAYAVQGLYRR